MQTVAIKRLLTTNHQQMSDKELEEFMGECELMMSLRPHKNVVQLLGVCVEPVERALHGRAGAAHRARAGPPLRGD